MKDFSNFLRRYRRRVDEGETPSNTTGDSIATPVGGAPTFTRRMNGQHPHYTVEDDVYRAIRKGKKKYSRWDKFIQNDSTLCGAVRECMGKFGTVTVESKLSGQGVRLRK